MPIPSGLSAQIGYAAESTYGTRVAASRFLEFVDESLVLPQTPVKSKALRTGQQYVRSDRVSQGKKAPGGTVTHELANKGFGLPLKWCLGASGSSQPSAGPDPTVWEHTLTPGDLSTISFTTQEGVTDVSGTTRVFEYPGSCVNAWEFSQGLEAEAMLAMDIIAQDETTNQTLAVASYPASQTTFDWSMLAVTVNGAGFDINTLSIKGDNALKDDRFFTGSRTRKHPISNKPRTILGQLDGEFNDLTNYALVQAGTIVAITAKWTGAIISSTFHYALEITLPACLIMGDTPVVKGPAVVPETLKFEALDGGAGAISVVYRTTDTTV